MEALRNPNGANSSPLTPLGFLERAATVFADSPSLVYNNLTYTWSHTFRRCLQLASSISRLGIKKSDVVSVLAPNIPATYELHFAATMTGAIINTINIRLDARTISVLLRHSESKLLFVDYEFTHLVQEALRLLSHGCDHPQLVLITEDAPPSSPTNQFLNTYENMVETGDPGFNWVRPVTDWDPLTLNYKSRGTSSSPKGVVHSHRGTFIVAMDSLLEWNVPKQAVYLWTLPMYHSNGWSYVWGMAAVGATNICLCRFDTSTIFVSIRRHKVTHMCGAPVILELLSQGENKKLDHPIQFMTARVQLPEAVLQRTESLGFHVTHGYGLMETGGMVVGFMWKKEWNRLSATERARLKARQGVRTAGMTAVDIMNKSGVSLRRDGLTHGSIVVQGGCLMLGYCGNVRFEREIEFKVFQFFDLNELYYNE